MQMSTHGRNTNSPAWYEGVCILASQKKDSCVTTIFNHLIPHFFLFIFKSHTALSCYIVLRTMCTVRAILFSVSFSGLEYLTISGCNRSRDINITTSTSASTLAENAIWSDKWLFDYAHYLPSLVYAKFNVKMVYQKMIIISEATTCMCQFESICVNLNNAISRGTNMGDTAQAIDNNVSSICVSEM